VKLYHAVRIAEEA